MKTKSRILLTAAIAICALGLGIDGAAAATKAKQQTDVGRVKSVDGLNHSLMITESKDNSDHEFRWTSQTRFSGTAKEKSITDLKAGDQVRITYRAGVTPPVAKHVALTTHTSATGHRTKHS